MFNLDSFTGLIAETIACCKLVNNNPDMDEEVSLFWSDCASDYLHNAKQMKRNAFIQMGI